MLKTVTKALKANRLLRALLIPIISTSRRLPFNIHRIFFKSFHFKLRDGSALKIYSKGQIAPEVFRGTFEKQELNAFQGIIRPGMTIVDAGANIGLYSLIGSRLVGPKGRVFSFEPSGETFRRLLNNIGLNGFSNIEPFNNGLGDKSNERLILRQDIGYGDAERYLLHENRAPDIKVQNVNDMKVGEEILVDTLDSCLAKFDTKRIDFLKLDTEGFEYYVLKGAKQILENSSEIVILMECTALGTARARTSQEDVFGILKEYDLNIFYWNAMSKNWCDDVAGTLKAGDVWGCKDKNQLKS